MKLDLGKCELCDKAVVHEVGKSSICPECMVKQNELYVKIRSLLRDYPDRRMTITDVAEILAVDEREVRHLLGSGLFSLSEDWNLKREREI